MIKKVSSKKMDCNCYIVAENNKAIIIDPCDADLVSSDVGQIADNIVVDYIILTHEHFDHIAGLEKIRSRYNAPLLACKQCSEGIQTVAGNLANIADILMYFKTGVIPEDKFEPFTCEKADISFDDEYVLEWEGHKLKFYRIPGHSPGSVAIFMDNDKVFTGDYMIKDEEVLTRLKGGSTEEYEQISKPILDALPKGTHIYPGHGPDYIKE